MGFNQDIKNIMTDCQSGNHNIKSLISRMSKLHKEMNKKEFELSFIFCLKKFLIIIKKEPQVERGLEFISKYVSSLKSEPEAKGRRPTLKKMRKMASSEEEENDDDDDDDDEEEMHPFQLKIFKFLIKNHDAFSKAVRFRCCQLINMILSDLGEKAQIDSGLFDDIHATMLSRVRDMSHDVRVQAVLGMRRLQEPGDPKCEVVEVYLNLLERDQNPDVRRAVLDSVAVTHGTLKFILKRTRDVNDGVRRLAYKVMAEKVHIKAMPISSRVTLVKRGLADRSEQVRDCCLNVLIKAWLGTLDGDLLRLLDCLDCQNYLPECQKLISTLLQKRDPAALVLEFDVLDDRHCIPPEKLTKENALLWRCLCQHVQALGAQHEEHLEKLMPTCVQFVDYLKGIMKQKSRKEDEDVFEAAQNNFILHQVLVIMSFLDISDEVGRKAVLGVIRDLLLDEHTPEDVAKQLVEQHLQLVKDDDACLAQVTEIISDILQPIANEENTVVEADKRRKLEIRMAELNVELMHLRDVLEDSITKQDFNKAAEVKSSMEDLEKEKNQVEREISGRTGGSEDFDDQSQVPVSQSRSQPKEDPLTLMRCLTIIQEVLKGIRFSKLNSSILSFINMLIIPGITSPASGVRNLAMKCLGLCCLRDPKKIGQYLMLFMQATIMDTEEIKVTAFKCMFNFLHFFGFPTVKKAMTDVSGEPEKRKNNNDEEEEEREGRGDDAGEEDDFGTNILNHMTKNLDSESSAVRTTCAEGLSKLLVSSRLSSPSLLTRLLLLWYNPMTEEDTKMRQCLASFFPFFAFMSRANQEMVGEAFMPTLKTLLDAPSSSPLSQVKVMNVAELMVHLSNFKHRKSKVMESLKNREEMPLIDKCPHDDIAVALCNEILTDPGNVENVRTYAKTLLMLDLTPENDCLLKSLGVLSKKMVTEVQDPLNHKYLLKFLMSVCEMVKGSRTVDQIASKLDETVVVCEGTTENSGQGECTSVATNDDSSTVSKEIVESVLVESQRPSRAKRSCTMNKKKGVEAENESSGSDFEASPPQQVVTRNSIARKAKETAVGKQIFKNRKRNLQANNRDDNSDVPKESLSKKKKLVFSSSSDESEEDKDDDDDVESDCSDDDPEEDAFDQLSDGNSN